MLAIVQVANRTDVVHERPPGEADAVNCATGSPPSSAGGTHETWIVPPDRNAVTSCAAKVPGTVAMAGADGTPDHGCTASVDRGVTAKLYVVPSTSPAIRHVNAGAMAEQTLLPGEATTSHDVTGPATEPSLGGAAHETSTKPGRTRDITDVAVRVPGGVTLMASEGADVQPAAEAVTVMVETLPLVKPSIRQAVAGATAEQVWPLGCAVAV